MFVISHSRIFTVVFLLGFPRSWILKDAGGTGFWATGPDRASQMSRCHRRGAVRVPSTLMLGLALAAASPGFGLGGKHLVRARGKKRFGLEQPPVGLVKWTAANCTETHGPAPPKGADAATGCGSKYVFGDTPQATAGARNDTLRCDLVFDGACHHLYRDAFWHRLVDCIVPSYAVLAGFARAWKAAPEDRKVGVCLMLHVARNEAGGGPESAQGAQSDGHPQLDAYANLVASVLPLPHGVFRDAVVAGSLIADPSWRHRERVRGHPAERFAVQPRATVTTWALGGPLKRRGCSDGERATLRTLRSVLTARVAADVSLGTGGKRSSRGILLIRRVSDERAFADFDAVRTGIHRRVPEAVISTYWGNESVTDTAALFHRNRVVVGFHGAGLVNTLFLTEGSLVVELTTTLGTIVRGAWAPAKGNIIFSTQYADNADGIKNNDRVIPAASSTRTEIWRTNDVLANCNQLRWQKYLLPHSQLGFAEGDLRRSDIDKSHMLRKSPAVTLKKPDLNRIGSVIREWFGDGGGP